jgi:hypothetical protein
VFDRNPAIVRARPIMRPWNAVEITGCAPVGALIVGRPDARDAYPPRSVQKCLMQ